MDEQNTPQPDPGLQQPNNQQWQYQSGNLTPDNGFQNQVLPPAPQQENTELGQNTQTPSQPEQPMTAQKDQPAQTVPAQATDSIHWQASEFITQEKSRHWYLILGVTSVVVAAATYFLTRDVFSVVVIFVIVIALGFFAAMKPRVMDYTIGHDGVTIGNKHFEYIMFKSFAVIDGQTPAIMLMPQKRFGVPVNIYFSPQDEEKIVNVLGEYLPYEHKEPDMVDRLSTRLHF